MNSGMDFSVLNSALQLVRPVAQKSAPGALGEFESLIAEKCGKQTAKIMIYGIYSHGKSTLVNALLGEEAAAMDLPPTTSGINEYPWEKGRCILIDTPGIEAKDEHTTITDAALKKCELVAFVVETSGVETGLVWREIVRLTQLGQKVCLVINDFDNIMLNSEKKLRLEDLFRCNLQKASAAAGMQQDIVELVPLLFVNAKLALRARLESRPDLLKISGLEQVEEAFTSMAASLDMSDIVTNLRRNLLQLIAICRIDLAQGSGNELLAASEDQLAAIIDERDRALLAITREVETRVSLKRTEIADIYENQASNQTALEQALAHLADTLVEEISPRITQELTKASQRIKDICQEFDAIRVRIAPESIVEGQEGSASSLGFLEEFNWTDLLNKMDWEGTVKDGIVRVLQQLKEWFPSLLFGKGAATFGRWATMAGQALGALVSVGTVIYQLYSNHSAEQEALRRAERKAQALADAVSNAQQRFKDAFMAQIEQFFEKLFAPLLAPLTQQIEALRNASKVDAAQELRLNQAENLLRPVM